MGPDTNLCSGDTIVLTSEQPLNTTYRWQNGSADSFFLVDKAGNYFLVVANVCGEATDSVVITFTDLPKPFNLGKDTLICPGESFVISSPVTGLDLMWQDGSNLSSLIIQLPGTYFLQASNMCGKVSDTITVSMNTNDIQINFEPLINWCLGDIITLDATQAFTASYLWNTGEISSVISINTPGIYEVEVTSECMVSSGQTEILAGDDCIEGQPIFIPNIFSPNGDYINDDFSIFVGPEIDLIAIEGSIFDRWGNMIFHSAEPPFIWNGKFKGELMAPGVYVYRFKIDYLVNDKHYVKFYFGEVTLIR